MMEEWTIVGQLEAKRWKKSNEKKVWLKLQRLPGVCPLYGREMIEK